MEENDFSSICPEQGQDGAGKSPAEKRKRIKILLVMAAILAILLLCLAMCCGDVPESSGDDGGGGGGRTLTLVEDDDAVVSGEREKRSREEIIEELNEKVEEGYINISMNTTPYFSDGSAKGNLLIYNDESNRYPQVIEIYLTDENDSATDLIYTSPVIPVGSRIDRDELDTALADGTYRCVAYFNSVDASGNVMGTAGAMISITVG